jgi:FAD/FMN-containing dehydrogenase
VISPRAAEYAAGGPTEFSEVEQVGYEPTSAAKGANIRSTQPWRLVIRASGSDNVLARYTRELGSAVIQSFAGEDEATLWRGLASFEQTVRARHQNAMLIRSSVVTADLAEFFAAAEETGMDNNFLPAITGAIGLGLLKLAFVPLSVDPPSAMQYANAVSSFRAKMPAAATAIVTRCPSEAKPHFDVWGTPSSDREMMRKVKHALDPANVLNRGRFVV